MTLHQVLDRLCTSRGWRRRGNEIRISVGSGREQRIDVRTFQSEDDCRMIRVTTGVGDAGALDSAAMRSALRVNNGLAHGALAIDDGTLVITDTCIADEALLDQVERSMTFVAATADRYERVLFGTDLH